MNIIQSLFPIPNVKIYIWSHSCETRGLSLIYTPCSHDQNLPQPWHRGVKNEMQISAHFPAVWMQVPHALLCGVKVLQHHPALSELLQTLDL